MRQNSSWKKWEEEQNRFYVKHNDFIPNKLPISREDAKAKTVGEEDFHHRGSGEPPGYQLGRLDVKEPVDAG